MGSKSGGVKGYLYYMGLHMGICRGPVDGLMKIEVGGKMAWPLEYKIQIGGGFGTGDEVDGVVNRGFTPPVYQTFSAPFAQEVSGPIIIHADKLFGGPDAEGGIAGPADIMMGGPTQAVNPKLATMLGGLVSAFRGMFTIFYDGLISANNPYPKVWRFRVRRALKGWFNDDCYYPDKAIIYLEKTVITSTGAVTPAPVYKWQGNYGGPACAVDIRRDAYVCALMAQHSIANASDLTFISETFIAVDEYQASYTYVPTGATLYTGARRVNITLPAAPTTGIEGIWAMNPAHMIYECLTNPEWGRGLDPAILDTDSFDYAAEKLCCEGFGLCMKWSREDDIMVFVQIIVDHIGAVIFPSRETGLLVLRLVRADYVAATLPLFTPSTGLLDVEDDDATTVESLVNEVIVKYVDPITGDDQETRVHNVGAMQAQGAVFSKTVSYPGIPTHELASRVAQRDLRIYGTTLRRLKLKLDRRAWQMSPGRAFKISHPERGIGNMIVRAGRVEDNPDDSSAINVTVVQDIFGLPSTAFVGYVPATPGITRDPISATRERIFEAGYVDTARQLTAAELAGLTDDDTFVFLSAAQPTPFSIDYRVLTGYVGSGRTDRGVGIWSPTCTMPVMGALDKTFVVSGFTEEDRVQDGDAGFIDDELVQIVTYDPATSTMVLSRGCGDTVPRPHPAGSAFFIYYRGFGKDATRYPEASNVSGKVLGRTLEGTLAETLANSLTITTVNRRMRPYPMGKLEVDGVPFPSHTSATLPVVFTWAERNRMTQGDILVGHAGSNVVPEVGTTYTAVVAVAGVPIRRFSGITGNSWAYTNAMWIADGRPTNCAIELFAERAGFESWQRYSIPFVFSTSGGGSGSGWGTLWGQNWGGSPATPTPSLFNTAMVGVLKTAAAAVRAGNRQVIFYKFGGTPSDGNFNPPLPQLFRIGVLKKGPVFGDPDVYNSIAQATLFSGQAFPLNYVNNQVSFGSSAGVGDVGLNQIFPSLSPPVDAYAQLRASGPPYPSDWCQNFTTAPPWADHCVVFPVGEIVRWKANPAGVDVAAAGEHQIQFYTHPNFPLAPTVKLDVHFGTGFLDKVTTARAQVSTIYTTGTPYPNEIYRVAINGVIYDYTAVVGDTLLDVRNALTALIDAGPDVSAVYDPGTSLIVVTGSTPAIPFTITVGP